MSKQSERRLKQKYIEGFRYFAQISKLYSMLVDDKNRSCLFYGSTLQKSIRQDPSCSTLKHNSKKIPLQLLVTVEFVDKKSIHEMGGHDDAIVINSHMGGHHALRDGRRHARTAAPVTTTKCKERLNHDRDTKNNMKAPE
ncbi:unnamed protein product [Sphenostylis stenocarpa]|uniref:Uncharacterized protein n=1 Tax=Sphenostylis stenocarpa TaxID=92480 RepID=A0AA86VWP0_9FABA|nr:unnamed protein product [Sphenostylis stenocarpa]